MSIKELMLRSDERFLKNALLPEMQEKMIHKACVYRNIFIGFFLVSFVCIFICGFSDLWVSTIIPLFLSTLSLVVLTKYDTQLIFLRIMQYQKQHEVEEMIY